MGFSEIISLVNNPFLVVGYWLLVVIFWVSVIAIGVGFIVCCFMFIIIFLIFNGGCAFETWCEAWCENKKESLLRRIKFNEEKDKIVMKQNKEEFYRYLAQSNRQFDEFIKNRGEK